jgi:hypothetical protein
MVADFCNTFLFPMQHSKTKKNETKKKLRKKKYLSKNICIIIMVKYKLNFFFLKSW